jgi:hypothetical protein
VLLCSECFRDHGLSLDAHSLGVDSDAVCPKCASTTGRKLDRDRLLALADTFFVRGTLVRAKYGAAPVLQFNEHHHRKTEIEVSERLLADAALLGEAAGVGFFHYGPRLWMLGGVEPLKALHDASIRHEAPVQEGLLRVDGINRLVLRRVMYDVHFGPAGLTHSASSANY